jgi:hypothetical protein
MSYSEVTIKRPKDMTLAELRQKADAEGLAYYKSQYEQDPNNPQARYEFESYCHRLGVSPNKEVDRLQSLSRAQLAEEWTAKGKVIVAEENDTWKANNAQRWIASQPAYQATPENGAKIVAEMESRGLRGSVADMEVTFDYLVKHGDIQPKPLPPPPVHLPSMDEFRAMSSAEMKAFVEQAGREGIL